MWYLSFLQLRNQYWWLTNVHLAHYNSFLFFKLTDYWFKHLYKDSDWFSKIGKKWHQIDQRCRCRWWEGKGAGIHLGNLVTLELTEEEKGAACLSENSQAVEMVRGEAPGDLGVVGDWDTSNPFLCRGLGGAPLGCRLRSLHCWMWGMEGSPLWSIKHHGNHTHTAMSLYILWRSLHVFLTADQGPHRLFI